MKLEIKCMGRSDYRVSIGDDDASYRYGSRFEAEAFVEGWNACYGRLARMVSKGLAGTEAGDVLDAILVGEEE